MNYGFCEEKENHYKLQVFFYKFRNAIYHVF